ncbi:LysR family transcriptional regulator [Azospirillum sp. SYSU D00513]|uniref:LysR family transcriptional regulator n=1 Tax=Azospirillum sp. SYSU D00513 TaxID=2812561 RepID=UPI001A970369|nr:LysR family transcriptional regulator [Azospirillum sp. SYSU D00513]
MDSTDLAFFVAVVEEGGVTAAARRLNCVQSNVTARIRALEAELGVALFHRNGRGVQPTRAAQSLLPHARRTASALADARAAVRDLLDPGLVQGRLAIGSMETTAAVRLPAVLAAYHRDFPQVELALETGSTGSLLAAVASFGLDAALVAGPVEDPALQAEPVGTEEMIMATAAGPGWTELLSRPGLAALSFRRGCSYRERLAGLLASLDARHARIQEFGTLEGIIGGVAAGIGVALLPRAAVEGSRLAHALALHPVPEPWNMATTVLVRRRDALVTAALARFADYARIGWAEERAAA